MIRYNGEYNNGSPIVFTKSFWKDNIPSAEEIRRSVDRNNVNCPFYRYVGNNDAIEKLTTYAYSAMCNESHFRQAHLSLFGPPSTGKTTLARIYADTLGLPYLEVGPDSVIKMENFFPIFESGLEKYNAPITQKGTNKFVMPPCIILLDEIHAFSKKIIQGLLKATEKNDSMLILESGVQIDTRYMTWFIATTDEGRLFDAFRTRFSPINLEYLRNFDIALIVGRAYPLLPPKICQLVAKYNSCIPRQALRFAQEVIDRKNRFNCSYEDAIDLCAKADGIDEHGMHKTHLKILFALDQKPIPANRIQTITGKKLEENENYIMPWLLTQTEDKPAYVCVTGRGYTITEAGKEQLRLRKMI